MAQLKSAEDKASKMRKTFLEDKQLGTELVEYFKEYAREKPEMAALWCFGIGFILGWKLKPW